MKSEDLPNEIPNTKTDIKKENVLVEYGTTETLAPEDEKKLIRKIDWQ
jgi:ACS family allantoate permease-like MFS transporter